MITYHAILKGVSLLVGISFENRVRLDTASKVRPSALVAIKHKRIGGRKIQQRHQRVAPRQLGGSLAQAMTDRE